LDNHSQDRHKPQKYWLDSAKQRFDRPNFGK